MIIDPPLPGGATATPPRPVIFARSATDGEGQLQQRVEDAREIALMHGLDVAPGDIIAERGDGATIGGRPGIQRILEQAARGEISHVVTSRNSDLSRDYHEQYRILVALADAGVTVVNEVGNNLPSGAYAMATAMLAKQG